MRIVAHNAVGADLHQASHLVLVVHRPVVDADIVLVGVLDKPCESEVDAVLLGGYLQNANAVAKENVKPRNIEKEVFYNTPGAGRVDEALGDIPTAVKADKLVVYSPWKLASITRS